MTYLRAAGAVHRALRDGRVGRYDDGAWGHPSWRARVEALYRRFAARLARRVGPIAVRRSTTRGGAAAFARVPVGGDDAAASRRRPVLPRGLRPRRASRCRSCRCWTARSAAGTWPTGSGRPRTTGSTPTRSSSSPAPRRSPASPAPTSPSPSCSPASRRPRSRASRRRRSRASASPLPARRPRRWRLAAGDGPVAALCAAQCVVGEDGRTRPNPLWRLSRPATRSPARRRVTVRPSSATVETRHARAGRRRRGRHVDTATADPLVLRCSRRPAASRTALASGVAASAGRTRGAPRRVARASAAARRAARAAPRCRAPTLAARVAGCRDGAAEWRRPTRSAVAIPRWPRATAGRARPSCRARTAPRPARRTTACRSTSRSRSRGPR